MEIVDLRKIRLPGQAGPVAGALLVPVLYPVSLIYGGLAALRRCLPGSGPDVGVPVISVGSVLVGGTGKTPLCMLVAENLTRLGRRVCVISRGYRRMGGRSPLAVSNGVETLADVGDAGDEPYLMAERLPGVCVMVDKDRARAARAALSQFRPDVFVLDDGFQTRSILKHLEIVCVDAASLRSRQFLLPAGRLRERWCAIKPEHVLVIVLDEGEPAPDAGSLERFGVRRTLFALRDGSAILDGRGDRVSAASMGDRRFLVLSGIARPASFEHACKRLGLRAVISLRMDDHHWYNDGDAERVASLMKQYQCTDLITTEKDFHRLPQVLRRDALIMREDLKVDDSGALTDILQQAVRTR